MTKTSFVVCRLPNHHRAHAVLNDAGNSKSMHTRKVNITRKVRPFPSGRI